MPKTITQGLAALALLPAALCAQSVCGAHPFSPAGTQLQLLPPAGFVEVCAHDTALCRRVSAGYPPSATTLGYFVPETEWRAYRQGTIHGFTQYLIAQRASSISPSSLPKFKQHVRAQQGDLPDHTRLPAQLESGGRVPLGVFDESENSISFGVVMSMRSAGDDESANMRLVATNSALALGPHVLSLYVYRRFRAISDIDAAKQQTRTWLSCLRNANWNARCPGIPPAAQAAVDSWAGYLKMMEPEVVRGRTLSDAWCGDFTFRHYRTFLKPEAPHEQIRW
jgi:hypothetical protein